MARSSIAAVVWGMLALTLGCQPARDQSPEDRRLTVAVTTIPHAWLVRQVGGDHVEVITLVQPGANHETYQPSDAEVSRLMQADAYFRVGVAAEHGPWFQAIRDSGRMTIVDLRRGVPMLEMTGHAHHGPNEAESAHEHEHAHEHAHEHGPDPYAGKDPHIWLSPRRLKIQARTVAETLAELDPAHKADYQRNLAALEQRLDEVDATIQRKLEGLQGKAFFIYHPAWGYFAHDYGLRQVALEREGKEPSDEELTRLQQQVQEEGAKVIFVQPQISGQSAEALAEATGGEVKPLDPLAEDVPANLLHVADVIAESYR